MVHTFLVLFVVFVFIPACSPAKPSAQSDKFSTCLWRREAGWQWIWRAQSTDQNEGSSHTHRIWGIWNHVHKKQDATCKDCCHWSCGETRIVSGQVCVCVWVCGELRYKCTDSGMKLVVCTIHEMGIYSQLMWGGSRDLVIRLILSLMLLTGHQKLFGNSCCLLFSVTHLVLTSVVCQNPGTQWRVCK